MKKHKTSIIRYRGVRIVLFRSNINKKGLIYIKDRGTIYILMNYGLSFKNQSKILHNVIRKEKAGYKSI